MAARGTSGTMAKYLFDALIQEDVGEMEECDHGPAYIYIYTYI